MLFRSVVTFAIVTIMAGVPATAQTSITPRRFFADTSFWNQKIAAEAETDRDSARWISLLEQDQTCRNFGVNVNKYTIPVYVVDAKTPRKSVRPRHDGSGQSSEFQHGPIPIPKSLTPSPGDDAHVAIVDYGQGKMWDMWNVSVESNGDVTSSTGMITDLNGPGVYQLGQFGAQPGDSIHQFGPSRAAGVPAAAGLIMYDEVAGGRIEHKLAAAVRFVAYQEFVYPPAVWTDGNYAGGLPEGATLQLDPNLDLSKFDLTPEERIIARAMQEYGLVIVDFAEANVLYAEGLWSDPTRTWEGKIREWEAGIASIPLSNYRVIDTGKRQAGGNRLQPYFLEALSKTRQCVTK